MRVLVAVPLAIALAGCATPPRESLPSFCGDGAEGQWQLSARPPVDAPTLRALADSSPNFPVGKLTYPIEQWLTTSDGAHMLCRRDKSSCSGEWWQFKHGGGTPKISKQSSWICVTGTGPNNSFKPKPLRGSA